MEDFANLTNLSVALSNAVNTGLMSREWATGIWKNKLREFGLISVPEKPKVREVKKNESSETR